MDSENKLSELIETFNNNSTDTNFKKNLIEYLKDLKSKKTNSETNFIADQLKRFFKLKKSFFIEYGDYILELIWDFYDIENFTLEYSDSIVDILDKKITKTDQQIFYISQFCQFNRKFVDELKEIYVFSDSKLMFTHDLDNTFSNILNFIIKRNLSLNKIIDLLILVFMETMDFQIFYTTLSSFLVQSNSSSILLFKIISLFSYLMVNISNKENYVDSLIFVTGSVLRDHARSYLKTKNLYNDSLTYHVCKKKHTKRDHQFSDPKDLTSLECDYIEQNFLSVLIGFIISISFNSKYDIKWENYKDIFYKYIDYEDMDVEERIDKEITISNTLMLFLSDFIFFFISNFSVFENDKNINSLELTDLYLPINSKFKNFQTFISLSLRIFKLSTNVFYELFNFSSLNKRFLNFDCQRTNYQIRDKYNHYGISLLTILNIIDENPILKLNFDLDEKSVSNDLDEDCEIVFDDSLFPLVTNRLVVFDSLINSLSSILYFERNKTHTVVSYLKDYNFLVNGVLKDEDLLNHGFKYCNNVLEKYNNNNNSELDLDSESQIIKNLLFFFKELILSHKVISNLKFDNINVFEKTFKLIDTKYKSLILENIFYSIENKKEFKDLLIVLDLLKTKLNSISNIEKFSEKVSTLLYDEDMVLILFKLFDKNLGKEIKDKILVKLEKIELTLLENDKIEKEKKNMVEILNKILL